jgi:5-methylcytosine-specific restriction endonuclease McrA
MTTKIDEHRDIVFSPNLENSPTFGRVFRGFMQARGKRRLKSWTCKKTASPGDLYLFYFGDPEYKLAGFAICDTIPDPDGWKPRGHRQKMFFSSFDRLCHLKFPLSIDELRSVRSIDSWWETRPYHGRPKTIPPAAATSILKTIIRREPRTASLLGKYIQKEPSSNADDARSSVLSANEGTMNERLCREPNRSSELRKAKIREILSKHGRLVCEVRGCGFDFHAVYGELGRGFAHVHHRHLLASNGARRTKLSDLAIVCANCHAMIHRWGMCRDIRHLIDLA